MSKSYRLKKIQEFGNVHLHVLYMDYGLELEGIVRDGNPVDVYYKFDHKHKHRGTVTFWPGTNKIHIQKPTTFIPNGIEWLYKYAKKLKTKN